MFNTIFYKNNNGKSEVEDYIKELLRKAKTSKHDRIQADKILEYIKALQQYGTRIGAPVTKHIDGNIWELRPLENRIFFFYWENDTFVLLHHFIKKTQKTPKKEIDKARKNLADFLSRIKDEKNR